MGENFYFVGTWVKDDGLTFSITPDRIYFGGNSTNNFQIQDQTTPMSISFNWGDLNQTWGPTTFIYIDENTIYELGCSTNFHRTPPHHPTSHNIQYPALTPAQIEAFRRDGFLIIREAVDSHFVKIARKLILSDLGTSGIPFNEIGTYKSQSWVPNLRNNPIASQGLIDVFRYSALVPAISSLLRNPSRYLRSSPQVALIFPNPQGARVLGYGVHIDGVPTPTNGLEPGRLHGFNSLIGVALSRQEEDFCGNLVVYPGTVPSLPNSLIISLGSHILVNESLQRQSEDQLSQGIPEHEHKLGPGYLNWEDRTAVIPNDVRNNLPEPLQVQLQPGDAIICHYLLVHEVAPNLGDDIRMQMYLRVKSSEFDNFHSLLNMWRDYH